MTSETILVDIMAAIAALQGVVFLRFALAARGRSGLHDRLELPADASNHGRIERADRNRERISPLARYVASAVGFGMAGLLLMHLVTPAVAYAILCLAIAGRSVADQIVEEQTPRRRSALIGRSRSVDPVLMAWITATAATAFVLVPWLLDQPYRFAAVVVAVCVAMMVVVAWRIASASPLLFGDDLEAEAAVDRETRAVRTGNACFLSMAAVTIFVAFVGGQRGFIDHRFVVWGLEFLCVSLYLWKSLYARRLSRIPLRS